VLRVDSLTPLCANCLEILFQIPGTFWTCIRPIQGLFIFTCAILRRIYRTIILPVVLNGCEAWSLTLREKRRLKVFENRVLRRVFGPKRDEVTGGWRKLHNEELNDLYSLPILCGW
jgi:hypothetical protein